MSCGKLLTYMTSIGSSRTVLLQETIVANAIVYLGEGTSRISTSANPHNGVNIR